jgi:hypothetical protein
VRPSAFNEFGVHFATLRLGRAAEAIISYSPTVAKAVWYNNSERCFLQRIELKLKLR